MRYIHGMNLAGIDLNLLVAFDALMAERNVTRAASRVGLSQPAMSNALARLRVLLGDPILVRAARGMTPSVRARQLIEPVRRALGEIRSALSLRDGFDAAQSLLTFTIATMDYSEILVLPRLLARLRVLAPRAAWRVRSLGSAMELFEGSLLAAGAVDMLLVPLPLPPALPAGLHAQVLLPDRFVSVVRPGHPAARRRLTLERFIACEHVLIDPMGNLGGTLVDAALGAAGRTRRIAITVPDFRTAAQIVARTDLIAMFTQRLARALGAAPALRVLRPPVALPDLGLGMVWHERTHGEPAQVWLRARIAELAAAGS